MKTPREFACAQTSRSSQLACAGNDGGPHGNVCDLVTLAIEARDAEHRAELDRLKGELAEARGLLGAMPKTYCYRFGQVPGGTLVKDCGTCLSCRRAKFLAAPPPAESTPVLACAVHGDDHSCLCNTCCPSQPAPPDDIRARLDDYERRLAAPEAKGEPGAHAFVPWKFDVTRCGHPTTHTAVCGERRGHPSHPKGATP